MSYRYCSRSCWDAFFSKPISYFVTCFAGFYCQRVPEFHESSVYTAGTNVILESFKFKPWRWCKWNEKGCYSLCLISRLMGIRSQFWDMMLSAQRKVVTSNVISFTPELYKHWPSMCKTNLKWNRPNENFMALTFKDHFLWIQLTLDGWTLPFTRWDICREALWVHFQTQSHTSFLEFLVQGDK